MLGKKGFVSRVNRGVDAALQPGEQRLAAVYVRGQGGNMALVSLLGPMVAQPFILAATGRRLVLLSMGQLNAAHSQLIAEIPRGRVQVSEVKLKGAAQRISFLLDGQNTASFHIVPAWKQEAAQLAAVLGWSSPGVG